MPGHAGCRWAPHCAANGCRWGVRWLWATCDKENTRADPTPARPGGLTGAARAPARAMQPHTNPHKHLSLPCDWGLPFAAHLRFFSPSRSRSDSSFDSCIYSAPPPHVRAGRGCCNVRAAPRRAFGGSAFVKRAQNFAHVVHYMPSAAGTGSVSHFFPATAACLVCTLRARARGWGEAWAAPRCTRSVLAPMLPPGTLHVLMKRRRWWMFENRKRMYSRCTFGVGNRPCSRLFLGRYGACTHPVWYPLSSVACCTRTRCDHLLCDTCACSDRTAMLQGAAAIQALPPKISFVCLLHVTVGCQLRGVV